jgi:hypothetical protein
MSMFVFVHIVEFGCFHATLVELEARQVDVLGSPEEKHYERETKISNPMSIHCRHLSVALCLFNPTKILYLGSQMPFTLRTWSGSAFDGGSVHLLRYLVFGASQGQ